MSAKVKNVITVFTIILGLVAIASIGISFVTGVARFLNLGLGLGAFGYIINFIVSCNNKDTVNKRT